MKIYLASDHAGFELKEKIKIFLTQKGMEVSDLGPLEFDKEDDYPDFIGKAAEEVSKEEGARGIIFGGSGLGEAIVANKYRNIRCGVFYGPLAPVGPRDAEGNQATDAFEIVRLTRLHNDANILSIGSRFVKEEEARKAVSLFLETEFSGDERHARRIRKIKDIEEVLRRS